MTSLTIPSRYNGPPGSANGGITCGLLAQQTGLNEVTLRQPPPLGAPLTVRDESLYDGDVLIATSAAGTVQVQPAPSAGLEAAQTATSSFLGHGKHPYPTCFVCGPAHPLGLHLYPGPIAPGVVATPWTPLDDDPVMIWAALDCPSGWSSDLPGRPLVLGRMALRIDAVPTRGEYHVVMGWHVRDEGRKVFTGSALYTAAGDLLAVAQQTWIAV